MLHFLVHKIFTFYINGVLYCKCSAAGPKDYTFYYLPKVSKLYGVTELLGDLIDRIVEDEGLRSLARWDCDFEYRLVYDRCVLSGIDPCVRLITHPEES